MKIPILATIIATLTMGSGLAVPASGSPNEIENLYGQVLEKTDENLMLCFLRP